MKITSGLLTMEQKLQAGLKGMQGRSGKIEEPAKTLKAERKGFKELYIIYQYCSGKNDETIDGAKVQKKKERTVREAIGCAINTGVCGLIGLYI